MIIVCYSIIIVCNSIITVCYSIIIVCYSIIAGYSIIIVFYSIITVCYSIIIVLFNTSCLLFYCFFYSSKTRVANPKREKLHKKTLSKLAARLMKLYDIPQGKIIIKC